MCWKIVFAAAPANPTASFYRTTPSLPIDCSRIKQYHKEGQALRTETAINGISIGRRLIHLPALRKAGFDANRPLPDVQRLSRNRALTGQCASALRFADTRLYARILRPGLALIHTPPQEALQRTFHAAAQAVNSWCDHCGMKT